MKHRFHVGFGVATSVLHLKFWAGSCLGRALDADPEMVVRTQKERKAQHGVGGEGKGGREMAGKGERGEGKDA